MECGSGVGVFNMMAQLNFSQTWWRFHQVWPKPSRKAQWQEEEDGADGRRGGKNIREWTGLEFGKSQRAVENRGKRRKLVVKSSKQIDDDATIYSLLWDLNTVALYVLLASVFCCYYFCFLFSWYFASWCMELITEWPLLLFGEWESCVLFSWSLTVFFYCSWNVCVAWWPRGSSNVHWPPKFGTSPKFHHVDNVGTVLGGAY